MKFSMDVKEYVLVPRPIYDNLKESHVTTENKEYKDISIQVEPNKEESIFNENTKSTELTNNIPNKKIYKKRKQDVLNNNNNAFKWMKY